MTTTTPRLATEARQAEIVAAALRLARQRSPALITTTELAQAVGLSQGALFKHFESKEAIWLAAMHWVAEHLPHTLNAAAEGADEPLDALRRVFLAHVDFVATHPGVPRLIFHELQQPEDSPLKEAVRGLLKNYRALLLKLLKQALQQGRLAADLDAGAAVTMFLGVIQGLVMQSMASGQIAPMRAEAPRIFELYLRGIRATS